MSISRVIHRILVISTVVARHTMTSEINTCGSGGVCTKGTAQSLRYLTSAESAALDAELFSEYRYSVDQLMELAGLSVAIAVARTYPVTNTSHVLVVCGPGNNGGDGLVAARHLALFGYKPSLLYPKRPNNTLYQSLLHQCQKFGIPALEDVPDQGTVDRDYDVVVDALFGFSFKPPVRENLRPALDLLVNTKLPVCSVDVPSGWDVDAGPPEGPRVSPALLISLSAPKQCADRALLQRLGTKHYLGGRFLPPDILTKYNLTLPQYPQQEQIVQLT